MVFHFQSGTEDRYLLELHGVVLQCFELAGLSQKFKGLAK